MQGQGLLKDKVALVTGGANGLGRAIAGALAREGAVGHCLDVGDASQAMPEGWRLLAGDVTREADMASAFTDVAKAFGRLDVVVANAGVVPPWSETEHVDLEEWDRVFAVNVRGVMATLKHAVPPMKAEGGSIIAMASLNAWKAHPRQAMYTATKHAVLGIVRAAALDLGRYGIRVNAIGPGPIATDALRGRVARRASEGGTPVEQAFVEMAAESALGRIATEEDVARTAVFLASDLSSGQTGILVPVDCGMS